MRSIRRGLVLGLSIGTAGLAALAGFVSGKAVESQIRRDFDASLQAKAQALMTLTEQRAGVVELEFADEAMPEFSVRKPLEYFEIWLATGQVVERSRSLRDLHLPRRRGPLGAPVFSQGILPDGRPGRLISIAFLPQPDEDDEAQAEAAAERRQEAAGDLRAAEITLARGTEELEKLVDSIYSADLAVAGSLAVALALLVGWVVRRGFSPLDEVARSVGALDEHTLGKRIELTPPVRELEPIVRRLNLLLERLEGAFERERRFSGDVAHELRTPVAELRTLSEVGERWAGDADLARDLFRDAAKVAGRMERAVEQMLAMAQADSGRCEVVREAVELGALVDECLDASSAAAATARASAVSTLERPLVVFTDREKLTLVLRNLFDNALAHSPEGGTVRIATWTHAEGRFVLEVSNDAPDLEPKDLAQMFERFWRKDAARSGSRHSGLGLSLVRSLCGRLALDVDASLGETDHRLTVRLTGAVLVALPSPSAD